MAKEEQTIIVWDDRGNVVYKDTWVDDDDSDSDDDD